ncbi:MAG: T9SS type A sorting domain-containing protein [Crocinitomicaceae bacterium]|nr:T9SS type A sorting domain-containing protein [Crocinitomicaceae bacterium]
MKKNYINLLGLLLIMFASVGTAEAQCLPRVGFYFGEIAATAGCGTWTTSAAYGPGEYFRMPVLQGGSYSVSTCGAGIDTQITGFEGIITATNFFYNDDNGPHCGGTAASVDFVPTFTDYTRVSVQQYNCAPGGTASITVSVRQNNNLTFTSSTAVMCQGDVRALTATPTTVAVAPQPNSGDVGTFTGAGVAGTNFTAPVPAGASQIFTLTYNFGYCSTTQDITVYGSPTPSDAGVDQPAVCGGSAILQGNSPAIGTGTWTIISGPGSVLSPNAPNSTVSGLVAGSPTTLEWTITNGPCAASVTQVVLTAETVAPVPVLASLPDEVGECSVTPPSPTANDNCAGVVAGTPDVAFPITTFGTTVVTWTYDDGVGNTSTQMQNVIVGDVSAPSEDVASLSDVTDECEVTSIVAPTATDNCVGPVTGTPDVTFPITAQGITLVTWSYDDGNGNISTQAQQVIITDATAPVEDLVTLADVLDSCSATPVAPTALDNCAGTIIGVPDVTFPVTTQGSTTITWTYDDGNGNVATQLQNVILTDIIAPTADVASLTDVIECNSASPVAPTATDYCAGSITGTPDVALPITTPGSTLVTWTYDDGNGNTSTQTQNVTVNTVDVGVTLSGTTITADETAATAYQWIDCDTGNAIIGETNSSYTPVAVTGNYSVEITNNGCVDTSACTLVDYSGLEEIPSIEVSIYPNPTDGKFSVEFSGLNQQEFELRIIDLQGRVVLSEVFEGIDGTHVQKVDISQNESGVYIINLIGDKGLLLSKRIVKD